MISSLSLDGFRNFTDFTAEFSPGVNVIAGRNAQGKTNLLEAVYYLTCARSFRASSDREMIMHGSERAKISAIVYTFSREQTLDAYLYAKRRRELFASGVRLNRVSELSGRFFSVLFCPDDIGIVRAGAAVRRRLMDLSLSQLRPRYVTALSEFNRLYDHKTRILRDWRSKSSLLYTLDDFNEQLALRGATLIYYRAAFAAILAKKAAAIHSEFTLGAETLSIVYKTVDTVDTSTRDQNSIYLALMEHQREHRQAELDSGLCLSGAHKDDLEIMIGGLPARKFASQGQARTAAVSIKLSERDIFFDDRGEYPVLLLDDVLSELDESRQSFLLSRITGGQVLITCCEDERISHRTDGRILLIEQGRLC